MQSKLKTGKSERKGQAKRKAVRSQSIPVSAKTAGVERSPNKRKFEPRWALTLGEQAETRVGSTLVGKGIALRGFTVQELRNVADTLTKLGVSFVLSVLSDVLDEKERKDNEAAVLLIKDAVNRLLKDPTAANQMQNEQARLAYDAKHFDRKHAGAVNSVARRNIVFGDKAASHSDDYRTGTIASWSDVPVFARLRDILPSLLGEKAKNLHGEGNFYYEDKSGIGFHGDRERKIVVGTSLGSTATLRFCWRAPHSSKLHAGPIDFKVEHGDIYVMSEKVSGYDWMQLSKYRLVHAAGADKFLQHKE